MSVDALLDLVDNVHRGRAAEARYQRGRQRVLVLDRAGRGRVGQHAVRRVRERERKRPAAVVVRVVHPPRAGGGVRLPGLQPARSVHPPARGGWLAALQAGVREQRPPPRARGVDEAVTLSNGVLQGRSPCVRGGPRVFVQPGRSLFLRATACLRDSSRSGLGSIPAGEGLLCRFGDDVTLKRGPS